MDLIEKNRELLDRNLPVVNLRLIFSAIDKYVKNWEYDHFKLYISKQDVRLNPPMVPLFWSYALLGELKDLDFFIEKATNHSNFFYDVDKLKEKTGLSPTPKEAARARIYGMYSGFVRELHVAKTILELCPKVNLYKNIYQDLKYHIDFIIKISDKYYPITVGHEGKESQKYLLNKKISKSNECLKIYKIKPFYLSASSKGQKFHTVSIESIKYLLKYLHLI